MLADLIRGFCSESGYEIYENYTKSWTTPIGEETVTCLAIIVKQDQNYFEMLYKLTRYMESKGFDNQLLDELEGVAVDELGESVVCYFPAIQNYP